MTSKVLRLSNEKLNSWRSSIAFANARERTRLWELIAGRSFRPRNSLERFSPHRPWPRQKQFLELDCLEAFYGGAAAGGKSEALLMAALEYVHVPGYSALILRRDTQRLELAGGLIPRAHAWLAASGARWQQRKRQWVFPTGAAPAILSFGYLRDSHDKYRYGSSEYQFIAFDELTEFAEEDYLFLFSRLRKTKSIDVPLRMRSASNPGNLGHHWVKRRFISQEAETALKETASLLETESRMGAPASSGANESSRSAIYWHNGAAFVPARIRDNPAVDEAEYRRNLAHLPPVFRERLMNGDWSIREEGLIRPQWLATYRRQGAMLTLCTPGGEPFAQVDERTCRRIATIDPAGTSADRARERRGRPASWSVIEIWDQPPGDHSRFLLLREVIRIRVGFDGLCAAIREAFSAWRPSQMYIEKEKLGQAAIDLLGRELPLLPISTGGQDKVARAAPLICKLERGEILLPASGAAWLPEFQTELLSWTGLGEETSDQIDAAAYAAILSANHSPLRVLPGRIV